MTGKIILNADLYDNILAEKLGDYVAKLRIAEAYRVTLRNEDCDLTKRNVILPVPVSNINILLPRLWGNARNQS